MGSAILRSFLPNTMPSVPNPMLIFNNSCFEYFSYDLGENSSRFCTVQYLIIGITDRISNYGNNFQTPILAI